MKIKNNWDTIELTEIKLFKGNDDDFYFQDPSGEFHRIYLQVNSPDGYTSVYIKERHNYHEVKE